MKYSPFDRNTIIINEGDITPDSSIAVIITLYNYENFICQCLDSIRGQDYPDIELVVVDDQSQDYGVDVARNWITEHKSRFQKVQLISHRHNRGLAIARNTGLAYSRSKYVFIMDADNELYPSALAKLKQAIIATGASAAYSNLEHFGDESCLGQADIFRKEFLAQGNYIDAMALFDKAALLEIGGYRNMSGWEDFDVWCRFIDTGLEAVFLPSILCRYRVHGSSMLRLETNPKKDSLVTLLCLNYPWLTLD
jgi:glycosyltransferase involved in cell wall biosynthesis